MHHQPKHVLVAPLDWGLGHATRCIPIIQWLLQQKYVVSIASSGSALKLLKLEFRDLKFFELPSYGVNYGRWLPFMIKMFFQLPKFIKAIVAERRMVESIVTEHAIDWIISDNRYGVRIPSVPSIFICHQINIIMPAWLKWASPMVNYFNHRWIKRFDMCWIPDDPKFCLSGKLSKSIAGENIYIGLLSRFKKSNHLDTVYQLAIVLSGPEPQRTVFEKLLLHQIKELDFKIILIRGVVNDEIIQTENDNLTIVNFLNGVKLQQVIEQSKVILCRPGYSSLMDLAALDKQAILVPTPGQTEQEYLGMRMMTKRIALCQSQSKLDVRKAMNEINNYSGFAGCSRPTNLLVEAIEKVNHELLD